MGEVKDSRLLYLHKLGVWVGEFNEEQLKNSVDKKCVENMKKITGLDYVNTKIARGNHGEKVLRIWVCNAEDFKI